MDSQNEKNEVETVHYKLKLIGSEGAFTVSDNWEGFILCHTEEIDELINALQEARNFV